MTLDLAPGATVTVDGYPFTVEEATSLHEVDFRMDLLRLSGATPAHERWLLAVMEEPYYMWFESLKQEWLAPPIAAITHDGEIFQNLYRGSAYRVRRSRAGRSKEGRMDYALFRADSGRVILAVGRNEAFDAWIDRTLPPSAVEFSGRA